MFVRKYMDENSLAIMLATKWSAGATPQVNLKNPSMQAIKHASEGIWPHKKNQCLQKMSSNNKLGTPPVKLSFSISQSAEQIIPVHIRTTSKLKHHTFKKNVSEFRMIIQFHQVINMAEVPGAFVK